VRPLDLFQFNVTFQQFHLFTVMPGAATDPIESPDYSKLRVSIVDITDEY